MRPIGILSSTGMGIPLLCDFAVTSFLSISTPYIQKYCTILVTPDKPETLPSYFECHIE